MSPSDIPILSPEQQWFEKKVDILNQFTPAEVEILQNASIRLYKRRGDILWMDNTNDMADSSNQKVYIVDQGYLRICESNPDGKRHILAMLGPADFFGHIAPGVATLSDLYTLEVVRDARLIVIEAKAFQAVLKNHFNLTMQIIKMMDDRQKQLERRISSFLFQDVHSRLVALLVELSEKYGNFSPDTGFWELQITHQELSDFLGVARQTVSTIMSEFSNLGLLGKRGRYLLLKDKKSLEFIVEQSISKS